MPRNTVGLALALDNQHRGLDCKHILGVWFSLAIRRAVEVRKIEPITNACQVHLLSLWNIRKDGIRHNQRGDIQKFECKDCGKWFTINLGFEGMKSTPEAITTAMQLYFTGESYRNIKSFLRLKGVKVSHVAILKWVREYVNLMAEYLEQIKPQVGDTWRTDEMFVKVSGNMKYLFAMMDDETRFRIVQQGSRPQRDFRC